MYEDDMAVHRIREAKDTNCDNQEAVSSSV